MAILIIITGGTHWKSCYSSCAVCSVQTQECNYRRTFAALRKKFRTFEEFSMASAAEIAKPLRSGGLYRHKSKRIQSICARLVREFGRATLAPLRRMKDAECEAFLTSLPGVGLKVARCVLVYSLGREVFPVDTHCWRISRRLGWIDPKMRKAECDDEDMERLQAMIPAELRLSLHVNFISLGREFCLDGNPCPR